MTKASEGLTEGVTTKSLMRFSLATCTLPPRGFAHCQPQAHMLTSPWTCVHTRPGQDCLCTVWMRVAGCSFLIPFLMPGNHNLFFGHVFCTLWGLQPQQCGFCWPLLVTSSINYQPQTCCLLFAFSPLEQSSVGCPFS